MYIPVSQIWALITVLSTFTHLEENSTPTVAFESKLNSSFVKRERMFVLPTLESPIKTTGYYNKIVLSYSYKDSRNDHP